MAQIIAEPAQVNPATLDWQAALAKTAKAAKGLDNLDCVLQNGIPVIKSGSSFELNGVIYECIADETILNWHFIPPGTNGYVTCVPDGNLQTAHFEFSGTNPGSLNYGKGGWYVNTARYFFVFYKESAASAISLQNMRNMLHAIQVLTSDPTNPQPGQIWMRVL
jgi:hypothetical protein